MTLCCFLVLSGAHAQNSETEARSSRKKTTPGIVLYNPANNHYYQTFAGSYTWDVASKKAAEHTFNGVKGHLATITSKDEYDFVVGNLWVYDYWIGGYRDADHLTDEPDHGWRWVTGEPFVYANWNDNCPADKELKPHVLSFWTGSLKWSPHVPTDTAAGYVVEYDYEGQVSRTRTRTTDQEIDRFLTNVINGYGQMSSYQATIEFTFKAFRDTIQNVKADLMLLPDGRFRLEGRGENGKLLAISDGSRLLLATTEPGERMKFVVKPMPPLTKALQEALSLLTSSPKPPSIVAMITGAFDKHIFSTQGVVGEFIESDNPEQAIRSHTRVKMSGEDQADGDLYLTVGLNQNVLTASDLSFRYKAYPYSVRETHSNIRLNEPIAENNFVLVITKNAEQVDD
jgi:hypothetical protein